MRQAYADDLAYIHDVGFSDFVNNAAPGLLAILRKHGKRGGLVIDLGCGSGIWARRLSDEGYDVLGIDISPAMIRLARKKAPRARFATGSFLSSKLPPCNVITAIGEVLNYGFDPRNGSRELQRFFNRAHEALQPGGLLIFDMAEPGRGGPDRFRQGGSVGKDWAILFRMEENRGQVVRQIVTFRKSGKDYRRSEETHVLRLYKRSLISNMLESAGFQVKTLAGYGRSKFPAGLTAFLAKKPRR
jgi:SAM-dependent methyltransferase